VFLELRTVFVRLRVTLFIHRCFYRWFRNKIVRVFLIFRVLDHFLFWLGRSNNKDFLSSLVTLRIAIKNVTSVLTVSLAESPSESFTHNFRTKLVAVLFSIFMHSSSNFKGLVLIISVSVIHVSLDDFLLVLHFFIV